MEQPQAEDEDLKWCEWACVKCPDPCDSAKPWPCARPLPSWHEDGA
jgi:hypothetical protein